MYFFVYNLTFKFPAIFSSTQACADVFPRCWSLHTLVTVAHPQYIMTVARYEYLMTIAQHEYFMSIAQSEY